MELLLFRHGLAGTHRDNDADDFMRPLTPKGIRRTTQVVRGLHSIVSSLDEVLTSPLIRARQTAGVLGAAYDVEPRELDALAPGGDAAAIRKALRQGKRVACVGHEPDLSAFGSWLLTGDASSVFELKKAGCALFTLTPRAPARLRWLLPPAVLRELAR